MSFQSFKSTFDEILRQNPLPKKNTWKLQQLANMGYRSNQDWFEVLYRTRASYQCNHRHRWESSWSMILFLVRLDVKQGFGRVRMKRFGQRCNLCKDDDEYHLGFWSPDEVWFTVQRLLLHILLRCYEKRPDCDSIMKQYIIPINEVPQGRSGSGPHQRHCCEACANDRCQETFNKLTKKK
ncbi:unnamed protein product [Rotaria magnacalcarata]|uniref:3CxxC-type domain-containing protein n=1 Tax=Rotaria magnacalcarata TaxID=392030 RepID=A0A820HW16_9BILA|nr:unnamed protein product [Rotaria magnacalcarata]CAF2145693.1 unnamed protein product [Rotaria magnacalcarata]CAF4302608.1 unnamed protein product [Rotaria magnacalcarata]CAF4373733.1 unnamed protein product [Rotaria magnacalcarata]